MNLAHIKNGDKLAIPCRRALSHVPHFSHDIVTVHCVTATQLVGTWRNGTEVRINRKNGNVIGREYYPLAEEVTPGLLARHEAEVSEYQRWRVAFTNTSDLIGKELHQLKLTTAQLERLAAAWAEVKAMGSNM